MRIPIVLLSLSLAAFNVAAASPSPAVTKAQAPKKEVLPFMADDFPKALKRAKALDLPLFVETWALW